MAKKMMKNVTKTQVETHSYPGLGKSCKRYYSIRPTVNDSLRGKLGNKTAPPKAPGVSY